jgi:hypothetical protein
MSVKSVVEKRAQRVHNYPLLMEHTVNGYIVFMYECKVGVVVAEHCGNITLGYHGVAWNMDYFLPFNDRLLLENNEVFIRAPCET